MLRVQGCLGNAFLHRFVLTPRCEDNCFRCCRWSGRGDRAWSKSCITDEVATETGILWRLRSFRWSEHEGLSKPHHFAGIYPWMHGVHHAFVFNFSIFASISARKPSNTAWAPIPSSSTPTGKPLALALTKIPSRGTVVCRTMFSGKS